jgi:hypothetical protein
MRSIYGYGPFLQGFVRIHSDTNLLIAYGSEGYVAMVESIVAAHQANQQAADKPK